MLPGTALLWSPPSLRQLKSLGLIAGVAPLLMTLLLMGWWWQRSTPVPMPITSQIPTPDAPKFHRLDCFHRNGIREPWEGTIPDGIIEQVGYRQYLVMFRDEAERRGGGVKVALPLTIETFDDTHHLIACPPEWHSHNVKKGARP